jgi:hypothetical protein
VSTDLTPATPPTVDLVADMLTEADNDLHDGYSWKLSLSSKANVVKIRITPYSEPDEDDLDDDPVELPDVHFRAVVVEGTETPLVLDRATFEKRVNERFDEAVRKLGYESLAFMPATIAALRQQILSLDVHLEASQAVQKGGAA